MAVILAFAPTIRAIVRPSVRLQAATINTGVAPRGNADMLLKTGPFRWIVDTNSGTLSCRFYGNAADPDPLSWQMIA